MPRETLRDIPSGPGKSDPVFTQQVSVQPVNPSFRPVRDQLEKLRDVLFSAGSALAAGLAATVNQRRALDARKQHVVQQQDREIAGVQAAKDAEIKLQTQRNIERTAAASQDLQLDPRAENPEWLLQQSSVAFDNAQTQEERDIWFGVIGRARSGIKVRVRDEKRELLEDINTAAMTSFQVVQQAGIELQNDPGLQAELIGNGQNIPGRVQDWILATVREAAPDIFDVREGDPDFTERSKQRDQLMAQLIKMSNPISNRLVKQYVKEVNIQNEVTASQKIDAAFTGVLMGNHAGVEELSDSMQEIEDTLMSHMTEGGKVSLLNRSIVKAMRVAADGGLDKNIGIRIEAAEILLAASGLSDVDQANLRTQFQEDITKAVRTGYIDAAKERILTLSKPQLDSDPASPFFGQRRDDLPDPNAAQTLALEGGYHQVAHEYLSSIGIDIEGDNPLALVVREEAADLVSKGMRSAATAINRDRSVSSWLSNSNGGDARAAYEDSAAFMSQTPGGMDETALSRMQRFLPEDQASELNTLLGGPVENAVETRVERAVIWGSLAKEINSSIKYEIAEELQQKLGSDWTQGDQESMFNTISFYRQIQNKQKFLSEFGYKNGLSASVSLNIAANKMFKARKSGPVPEWGEVVQDAQNVMARAELLNPDSLRKPATDAQGRLLVTEGRNGREFPVTRRQRIVTEIMGAIQQTDLLVDPLNLSPDKDLDVYFGVPKEDRSLFGMGLSLLGKVLLSGPRAISIGLTGEDPFADRPRFEKAEDSTPAEIEAFLDQSLQGFGEASLNNLVLIAAALEDAGMSQEDAIHGVVGFMANAGITIADTGSGSKLRFDPLDSLGPNRQNFKLLKNDVNTFLNRSLPVDDFTRLNGKFRDTKARFKDPTFFAINYNHLPHLIQPDRFKSPDALDWTPPEWRFATEEAAWQQGVNNGGAPIMFLTQDANPQWVMITDSRTNMPVFGFNAAELNAPSKSPAQRMQDLAVRIGANFSTPGIIFNIVQSIQGDERSAGDIIVGDN